MSLVHKVLVTQVVVFVCYLPPENSVWGRDAESFFTHLEGCMYQYSSCDHMFICGDLNARI